MHVIGPLWTSMESTRVGAIATTIFPPTIAKGKRIRLNHNCILNKYLFLLFIFYYRFPRKFVLSSSGPGSRFYPLVWSKSVIVRLQAWFHFVIKMRKPKSSRKSGSWQYFTWLTLIIWVARYCTILLLTKNYQRFSLIKFRKIEEFDFFRTLH